MELKKDRECIHCKKFFECEGKESKKPCLHFEEREKGNKNGLDTLQK